VDTHDHLGAPLHDDELGEPAEGLGMDNAQLKRLWTEAALDKATAGTGLAKRCSLSEMPAKTLIRLSLFS
jgi:hypothetical protein